jgi:hypothetical protein
MRWQYGPDLPSKRYHHCVNNINATTSFVGGGRTTERNYKDAYLYHWPIDSWVQLANTERSRYHIACSLYKKHHIVVVGGKEYISIPVNSFLAICILMVP